MSSKETRPMRNAAIALLVTLAAWAAVAAPAEANEPAFYQVTTSNTEAGGHPDISTKFTLPELNNPPKTVEAEWPKGVFGNPQAVPRCSNFDFARNECPSFSQIGWVGLEGLYEGDEFHIFGAAPLYDLEPAGEEETARFAFTVPGVDIPITIPIKVRTGSDYGLTLSATGITQQIPLREAVITVWGFPASGENDAARFPSGEPGSPPGCLGVMAPVPG